MILIKTASKNKKKKAHDLFYVKASHDTAPYSGPAPSVKTALKCAEKHGFKQE